MKIIIDTEEQEIIFEEGEWSEIIDVLKLYPDFTLLDTRFLIEKVEIPNFPVYPLWLPFYMEPTPITQPYYTHTIHCDINLSGEK